MKFRVYRQTWWHLFLTMFLFSLINNEIRLNTYPLWVFSALALFWFIAFGGGGVWLLNRLLPLYMTLEETELVLGKKNYRANEIRYIVISKAKNRSITIILRKRGKRFPLLVTPWKTERYILIAAVEQWSHANGIPISVSSMMCKVVR